MSDTTEAAPVVVPATSTAAVPAPNATENEPTYIRDRIERARREGANAALAKLETGERIRKRDDFNAKLDEVAKKAGSQKGERRALREENAALKKQAEVLGASDSVLKMFAETELAALPEDKREVLKKIAGDSPVEILKQLVAMRSFGLNVAPPVIAAPAAAPPAPIAAPAQSAPSQPSPPATAATPTNERQEYERLQALNPLLAADYALQNRLAIWPQR